MLRAEMKLAQAAAKRKAAEERVQLAEDNVAKLKEAERLIAEVEGWSTAS